MSPRSPLLTPFTSLTRALAVGGLAFALAACGGESSSTTPSPDAGASAAPDAAQTSTSPDAAEGSSPDAGTGAAPDAGDPTAIDAGQPEAPAVIATASPNTLLLIRGGSARLRIDLLRAEGADDTFALAIVGLPNGVIATVPAGISGDAAYVDLVADPVTVAGDYPITLRLSSPTRTVEATAFLALPDDPGHLDTTFDEDGSVDLGEDRQVTFLAELDDGRVASAWIDEEAPVFARFERDGSPDHTFGADGRRSLALPARAAAGSTAIVRGFLGVSGSISMVVRAVVADEDRAYALSLDADGTPRVLGEAGAFLDLQAPGRVVDAELAPAGLLVLSHRVVDGANEAVLTAVSLPSASPAFSVVIGDLLPSALVSDGQGGVFVLGADTSRRGVIARFDGITGAPEMAFGGGRVLVTGDVVALEHGVALADGSIVVVGSNTIGEVRHPFAALVHANGMFEGGFGADGGKHTFQALAGTFHRAAIDRDGRVLVAGVEGPGLLVSRLLLGGALDPQLGPAGIAQIPQHGEAQSLAVASGNRVLVGSRAQGTGRIIRVWY